MRGLLVNVLILGFLLTLYVYVNTDHEKTLSKRTPHKLPSSELKNPKAPP